jgi:hypothetical protein
MSGTDLVFPSTKHTPLTDAALGNVMKRLNAADLRMGGKGFVVRSNKRLSIARGEPIPVDSFKETLAAHVSFDDETKPTYARSEGVIGKAAKLTASQDHSLPLPSIPAAPECTWAIWVNLVRPPPNLGAIIQSDKAAFHVLFGEPFFRVQGAEHPAGANPETGSLPYDFTPHENRWTHIAVTYSSLTHQTAYFINGVRIGTTSGKITPPVAFENFRLGRFDGMLDDFRIYTSILKPKQVDALYQLGNQSLIPEVSWQHVSLNYNGSGSAEGMKLFLDGKEAPLAILENGLETDCYSSAPFRFGADADGKGFVGRIDDFTYFPRNLEAADLSEMLNPPPAPVPTPQP